MDSNAILNQYNELLFCVGDQNGITQTQKLILYFHSINLVSGLKCTGINEDDPESEYIIPPNWNIHVDDVYSFRYKNPKTNETIYFKYVVERFLIDVNVVRSTKTGTIYSSTFKLNQETNILDEKSLVKILEQYQKDIINPINDITPKKEEKSFLIRNEYPRPDPFFRPPQDPLAIGPRNPFGDYGSSDLRPVPLDPFGELPTGQGNLLGPGNPIFNQGPRADNGQGMGLFRPPGARFDPFGPDGISPFDEPKKLHPRGPKPGDPDSGFGGMGLGGNKGGSFGGGGKGSFWGPFQYKGLTYFN